jgi:hypothetical protein
MTQFDNLATDLLLLFWDCNKRKESKENTEEKTLAIVKENCKKWI